MAADELTALQRAAGVVGDLDPATAWDLDGQLDGLARVSLTMAEGMGHWSERLHAIGLHETVTEPIEHGVTGLGEIAASLTQSRRALRTTYASFFAAAESGTQPIDKPAFWGETAPAHHHRRPAPDLGDTPAQTAPVAAPPGEPVTVSATAEPPRGQVEPSDGPLPDTARVVGRGSDSWHGSDIVAGEEGQVAVGLYKQPDTSTYVVVATNPNGHQWEPDSNSNGIDPALNAEEAARLADDLEDLAALAERGTPTAPQTKLAKLAARVRGLLGDSGVTIIGDDGEVEVSTAAFRELLDTAAPEPEVATRRKVAAKACGAEAMDTGTVWLELDTSGAEPVVAVTSTEGNEQPEDSEGYYTTTKLSPADARQLAAKLRRFAATNPQAETATEPMVEQDQDVAAPPAGDAVLKAQTAVENMGYTLSAKQLAALHGLDLVEYGKGGPTIYGVNVRRQLEALADKGIIARTGIGAYMIPFGSAGAQIIAATPGFPVGATITARGTRPATAGPQTGAVPQLPPPAPAPAGSRGPRRVTNPRGKTFEFDPATGTTAVIEPDGWRAVVIPSSATGAAAKLLYWNAEIKDGRGEDATDEAARSLVAGLSAAELREVADETGTSIEGARTKAQLIDAIVNRTMGAPRKYRGLTKW